VAEDMAAITTTAPNQTGVLLQSSHEPLISQLPACWRNEAFSESTEGALFARRQRYFRPLHL